MIPPFDEHGYLPPGIHSATLAEIEERFGRGTEIRRAQTESLYWLIDLAKAAGIRRVIINGSFVTKVREPNDVDCVLLMPRGFARDGVVGAQLTAGLPFWDIRLVDQEETVGWDKRSEVPPPGRQSERGNGGTALRLSHPTSL
jgi:hypothetical protein